MASTSYAVHPDGGGGTTSTSSVNKGSCRKSLLGPEDPNHKSEDSFTTTSSGMSSSRMSSTFSMNSTRRIEGGQEFCSSMLLAPPSRAGRRPSAFIDLAKLRFWELNLHGRQKEQDILNECLQRISITATTKSPSEETSGKSSLKKQFVLIRGASGTGKTALAATLQKAVLRQGGIFALGKYSLQHQLEPFVAIASVCRQIFEAIAATKEAAKLDAFRQDLLLKLGDGIGLLSEVVPSLEECIFGGGVDKMKQLIPDGISLSTRSDVEGDFERGNLSDSKPRLHYVFRRLFRVIVAHYKPMVMVFDDLHRTDVASLELIKEVISDRVTNNRHVMFVGIYRSNEVDDGHLLVKAIQEWKEKNTSNKLFELTEIEIGDDIGVDAVDGIVTDLLAIDSSSATMALSSLCHRRTRGNVFFILCFLRMLRENLYLDFNLGTFTWMWDIAKIESETEVTTNVVDFMKLRMNALDPKFQTLLALASCLGYSFAKRKVELVTQNQLYGSDMTLEDIDNYLARAVNEGFLEEAPIRGDSPEYRWVHDNIQEAALSLIPEDHLSQFKYEVGQRLLENLEGEDLDASLFVVVELLNDFVLQGGLKETEHSSLAGLNLRAAKRASFLSAFSSAAKFSRIGISLLRSDHWQSQTQLALDLFSTATQAEASLGNRDLMMQYSSQVSKQPHIPLMDKMRVYHAQIESIGLGDKTRIREGVALCLDLLEQLGCRFPRSNALKTFKLVMELMKHKREMKSRTLEEVMQLPLLDSRPLQEIDKILNELSLYAYMVGEMELSGLCTMKQASITLKHGLHDASHQAFSSLAPFFMVAFNDLRGTAHLAEYALHLKERAHGNKTVSGFNLLQGCFCAPFSGPWHVSLKLLLDGYESGMKAGELRNAIFCISTYVCGAYFAGRSLGPLLADVEIYYLQTMELNDAGYPLVILAILRSCLQLLVGTKPGYIEGQRDIRKEFQEKDPFLVAMLGVFQGSIYYIFGDHAKGAALAQESGIPLDKLLSHSANMPGLYQQALSIYIAAQQKSNYRRRRLRALAMKRHKILRKWAQDGCSNVAHYVVLLDAELSILKRERRDTTRRLYQKAISLAARGGFVQDAAVANERLAEFLLIHGDASEAGRCYEQAIQYYEEWGIIEKVNILRERQLVSLATTGSGFFG